MKQLYLKTTFITIWCLYVIASFFPTKLWGIHSIAFLPLWQKIVFLTLPIFIAFFGNKLSSGKKLSSWFCNKNFIWYLGIITILFFIIYNPINDIYGDSQHFISELKKSKRENVQLLKHLFHPNFFEPKIGERTTLSLAQLAYLNTPFSYKEFFRILGSLSGLVFIIFWYKSIKLLIENKRLQFILLLVGICSPILVLFSGQIEIYTPVYASIMLFGYLSIKLKKSDSKRKYIILLILSLLIALRLHFLNLLLIPACILLIIFSLRKNFKFNLKKALIWIIIPFITIGTIVYFFILNAHNAPRFFYESTSLYERIFLPIFNNEPIYKRYTLLSLNHILDYLNVILLISTPFVFALIIRIFIKKTNSRISDIKYMFGATLLIVLLFMFAFTPMLSMPFDWDLYAIMTPLMLIVALLILAEIQDSKYISNISNYIFGIVILATPFLLIHVNKEQLSYRTERIGVHSFNTYWIRSADKVLTAFKFDHSQYESRYKNILKELKPQAVKNKDIEYSHLLWNFGKQLRKQKKYKEALKYHTDAQYYNFFNRPNYIGLVECNFMLKDYDKAHEWSKFLLKFNHPNKNKALRIAIHCALESEKVSDAKIYCEEYLKHFNDVDIHKIYSGIKNNVTPPELIKIFGTK